MTEKEGLVIERGHSLPLTPGQKALVEYEELLNPAIYAHGSGESIAGWLAFSKVCPTGRSVQSGHPSPLYRQAREWLEEVAEPFRERGERREADRFSGIVSALTLMQAAEERA